MKKSVSFIISMVSMLLIVLACEDGILWSGDSYKDSYTESSGGQGGSMARFAVRGDELYTVTTDRLKTFDISDASNITSKGDMPLSWQVETIFPYQNYLFIGTMNGMHIVDVSNPSLPQYAGQYEHVVSCDPVVVAGQYAYVTLHSDNNWCGRNSNELQIIDIHKVLEKQPDVKPEKRIAMTRPLGLGVTEKYLFVCDGDLKVFDRTDPVNPVLIKSFKVPDPFDVIPVNGNLMLISAGGFYQYAYTDSDIYLLSHINIKP